MKRIKQKQNLNKLQQKQDEDDADDDSLAKGNRRTTTSYFKRLQVTNGQTRAKLENFK